MWDTINNSSIMYNFVPLLQQKERKDSFKTKNYKLKRLTQTKTPMSNYKLPIINLSDQFSKAE